MNNDTPLICEFCSEPGGHLRMCGACRAVRYCSVEHQHKDWKKHKLHCSKLKNSKVDQSNNHDSCPNSSKEPAPNLDHENSILDSLVSVSKSYGSQNYFNGQTDQELDLSTPIDPEMGVENVASQGSNASSSPPLFQVKLSSDNNSITEELGEDWLSNVTSYVLRDLNNYGFCAVDNFFGAERAHKVVEEVNELHNLGMLTDGQVVSRHVQDQARGMIRGDKIAWVSGTEEGCETICQLVSTIDSVIASANKHHSAGKLAEFDITLRTRAMVACYPGGGTHYVKHVDNPNGDGRCVTAIYYLNENWKPQDGGILRIFPQGLGNQVAQIEPIFDRMLFFWSDRRNPHEVLPSSSTRYAITVWYLDQKERDRYRERNLKQLH